MAKPSVGRKLLYGTGRGCESPESVTASVMQRAAPRRIDCQLLLISDAVPTEIPGIRQAIYPRAETAFPSPHPQKEGKLCGTGFSLARVEYWLFGPEAICDSSYLNLLIPALLACTVAPH